MATGSSGDEERSRRRKRLIKGLLLGAGAVGLPALANALVRRRAGRLPTPDWGRTHRYAWSHGEVAFQRLGEGPPVVLLHSLGPGHDSSEWRDVAERLARSYQVYAPDLLGWGRSEKPPLTYDCELYIQLLYDFLKDVVNERLVLVAAGLPAAYAVQVAVDHPELFQGLALVVPAGVRTRAEEPSFGDALLHRLLRLPILGTTALHLATSRAAVTRHLRQEVFASPDRVDAQVVEHYYRASHQPGAHAPLAALFAGYLDHGVEEVLPHLSVPVWIAWGRRATNPRVEMADVWLHHLARADLEVFEGTRSLPHAEAPALFAEKLEQFLANLSG